MCKVRWIFKNTIIYSEYFYRKTKTIFVTCTWIYFSCKMLYIGKQKIFPEKSYFKCLKNIGNLKILFTLYYKEMHRPLRYNGIDMNIANISGRSDWENLKWREQNKLIIWWNTGSNFVRLRLLMLRWEVVVETVDFCKMWTMLKSWNFGIRVCTHNPNAATSTASSDLNMKVCKVN